MMRVPDILKEKNWKEVLCALIFFFMLIFSFYTLMLGRVPYSYFREEKAAETEESVSFSYLEQTITGDGSRLYSMQLHFPQANGQDCFVSLYHQGRRIYAGQVTQKNWEKQPVQTFYMNTPLKQGQEYRLVLETRNNQQKFSVSLSEDTSKAGELIVDGERRDRALAIQKKIQLPAPLKARLKYAIPRLGLMAVLFCLVAFFSKIKLWFLPALTHPGVLFLLQVGIAGIASEYVVYPGQSRMLPFIGMILVAGVCALKWKQTIQKIKEDPFRRIHWVVLWAAAFLSAFFLVGMRILVLPYDGHASLKQIVIYLLTVLWMVPVLLHVRLGMEWVCAHAFETKHKWPTWAFVLVVVAILVIPLIWTLYAFNPLISSPDTEYALRMVNGFFEPGFPVDDWIPVIYYFYVMVGMTLFQSVSGIAGLNIVFWTFVILRGLLYLRKKGIRDSWLVLLAVFIGSNPANCLLVNTAWKDIPYTCSLLWVTLNVVKFVIDPEEYGKKSLFYVELGLSLAAAGLFRKNGILLIILFTVCLFFLFRTYRKRWIAIVIPVCALVFFNGIIYQVSNVYDNKIADRRMYTGFAMDALGIYYADGILNEETLTFVSQATYYKNNTYQYDPTYYNYSELDEVDHGLPDFTGWMTRTIINNPGKYLKASVARNPAIVSFVKQPDEKWWRYAYTENYTEGRVPKRSENRWTEFLRSRIRVMASNPVCANVYWNCGLYSFLLVLSGYLWVSHSKGIKGFMMSLPVLVHIFSIWISSGYGWEYRFYWPENTVVVMLMFYGIVLLQSKKEHDKIKMTGGMEYVRESGKNQR